MCGMPPPLSQNPAIQKHYLTCANVLAGFAVSLFPVQPALALALRQVVTAAEVNPSMRSNFTHLFQRRRDRLLDVLLDDTNFTRGTVREMVATIGRGLWQYLGLLFQHLKILGSHLVGGDFAGLAQATANTFGLQQGYPETLYYHLGGKNTPVVDYWLLPYIEAVRRHQTAGWLISVRDASTTILHNAYATLKNYIIATLQTLQNAASGQSTGVIATVGTAIVARSIVSTLAGAACDVLAVMGAQWLMSHFASFVFGVMRKFKNLVLRQAPAEWQKQGMYSEGQKSVQSANIYWRCIPERGYGCEQRRSPDPKVANEYDSKEQCTAACKPKDAPKGEDNA
jgi:hypothetical protein